jgi:nitrogen fixation/metabolism regulation signal transduction histidine kinase
MLRQGVFAQRFVDPEIEVVLDEPGEDVMITCDARMIGQALTNILKNAGEAVGRPPLGFAGNGGPDRRQPDFRPTKTCA